MERLLTFKIEENFNNRTVQSVLVHHGFSASLIKSLKYCHDAILLNGSPSKLIDSVCVGDKLKVTITESPSQISPVPLPLDILLEDEDIIAINKPRNMPTHPSHEHTSDTLANALMHYFNSDFTFHPITRLDKDTSGVVLVAKNAFSAHILTESIKNKEIKKQYLAVTNGSPSPSSGTISAPLEKSDGIRRTVSPFGKEAITKYRTIKSLSNLSLVSLSPITGRTHQLRVHMAHIGTPIYGDWLYNPHPVDNLVRLHCHKLTFIHPITKEPVSITAPIPADILNLID